MISRALVAQTLLALAPAAACALAADALRIETSARDGRTVLVAAAPGAAIATAAAPGAAATALDFLAQHGALFGIADPATQLVELRRESDLLGHICTTYQQVHEGVPVFSGVLKVHQNARGEFVAANGDFYAISPKLMTVATLTAADAELAARAALGIDPVTALRLELVIVDPGWYGDPPAGAKLAWHVVLADAGRAVCEAFFVDAQSGEIIDQWSMIHTARNRNTHDANETSALPGPLVRSEGQPATGVPDADAVYDYAGDTYDYFFRAFGRDSINNAGLTLIGTARSTAPRCPNAFWNGVQTVYCSGMATDDVVGHEFTHGLTQYTAGLIYQNQSGQLNESMSDIFGEMVDLFNGNAAFPGAPGGTPWPAHGTGPGLDTPNNLRTACSLEPDYPDGVRWLVGEGISSGNLQGAIRDMWDPTCEGDPDRANSDLQTCPASDSGGVHSGSGVPNHAFAMLTDGKTFNGRTVIGIGPIKAAAVWYRALTTYMTPATDFDEAYFAFNQAAQDLIGTFPLDPRTGNPTTSAFTAADAAQVNEALLATEMNTPGRCGGADDVLLEGAPNLCANRVTVFADAFENGPGAWTVEHTPVPTPYDWILTTSALPYGRPGVAWFCADPSIGNCGSQDESGVHSLISPAIPLPAGGTPMLTFTHYIATEGGWDAGNLKVRVNNGVWQPIPRSAFLQNAYNGRCFTAGQGNTNPLLGQTAFTGAGGRWGASVVDLTGLAAPGQTLQVRFDLGKDGCTGVRGWYVDDFEVFLCPDCNNNGVVDVREFVYTTASEPLGPIGDGSPQTYNIGTPPAAGGDVTLTVLAVGDLSGADETIELRLNGVALDTLYDVSTADCSPTPEREMVTVPLATWNAAVGGGPAVIELRPSAAVNAGACSSSSYAMISVTFPRTTPDCDNNRIPDSCVNPAPQITQQPQSQSVCAGGSVTFTVAASGSGSLGYQWRRNGSAIAGATGASYTIDPVNAAHAGSYDCIVTNACGSATSSPAVLSVTVRADANCDGAVNNFDIDAFVLAVSSGQAAWESVYGCGYLCANDVDGDGAVTNFDIDPFVACLQGACP